MLFPIKTLDYKNNDGYFPTFIIMSTAFFALFYAIFLTSIAVGPVFITISSIGLNYGLKNSLFAVIGVIVGNCVYLAIGALTAQQIIGTISPKIMMFVSFFASLFLAKIAYGFLKKDIAQMQVNNYFDKNSKTIFKMLLITLSSPVVISGYIITFLTFADKLKNSFSSGLIGGLLGSVIAYSLIAIGSGIVGEKIKKLDEKKYYLFLKLLNIIAGILLGGFAVILITNFAVNAFKIFLLK